jgi:hypothetical protein
VDTTIGIALVSLMAIFVVVATYYFRRQAKALEYVAETEGIRFMRQKKLWRREDVSQIQVEKPLDWLSQVASSALDEPVTVMSVQRTLPEIPALDTNTTNGRRVVFSPLDPRALRKYIGGNVRGKKSAIARLERFAGGTPLLGRTPRKVRAGEQSLLDEEWFDVRAGIVGEKLEIAWGESERLWVYLVSQGG